MYVLVCRWVFQLERRTGLHLRIRASNLRRGWHLAHNYNILIYCAFHINVCIRKLNKCKFILARSFFVAPNFRKSISIHTSQFVSLYQALSKNPNSAQESRLQSMLLRIRLTHSQFRELLRSVVRNLDSAQMKVQVTVLYVCMHVCMSLCSFAILRVTGVIMQARCFTGPGGEVRVTITDLIAQLPLNLRLNLSRETNMGNRCVHTLNVYVCMYICIRIHLRQQDLSICMCNCMYMTGRWCRTLPASNRRKMATCSWR